MSRWLNICRTGLDIFREWLTLDDVMAGDKATYIGVGAGSSCATNVPRSSSK